MVTYKYSALSKNGEKVTGIVEAFNEMDAATRIKESCSVVLKLQEVKENNSILAMEVGNKLNSKAFTVMCSQFAIILRAGLPISRTVQLIADKTTDKNLKKILKKTADDVEAGRSLAAAFEEHGKGVFPLTFIETIRAGEETGNLEGSFQSMYEHFDKQTKLKRKVKSAISYPIFILIIAIAVVVVLMIYVVPTFTNVFDSMGAELPGITQLLISISNFFRGAIIYIIIAVVVIILAYKLYGRTEDGRINEAKFKLKLPVLGNIYKLTGASEFANTMATMMDAGIPLTRAINITSRVLSNYFISKQIGKMTEKIEVGQRLATSLKETEVMPDILVDMTAVGEDTGELGETMSTIAKYYDAELEVAINGAVSKLSPTILIIVAIIAAFIVMAIYIAMFEMYNTM